MDRLRDIGNIKEVCIYEISDKNAREAIKGIHLEGGVPTVNAYLCSDARNKAVRELLYQIPGVRVYCNAGAVVYNPMYLSTIVFDHGPICGAREYSKKKKEEQVLGLPAFANYVHSEIMQNAETQLKKVQKKFQAGIIYFDQERGAVVTNILDEDEAEYPQYGECVRIEHELKSLPYRYSKEEFAAMSAGQNPNLILLTNAFVSYDKEVFRIDLQRNTLHEIIFNSLKYAVSHALNGGESFKNTRSVIMCFDKHFSLPDGFEKFLLDSLEFFNAFKERGGEVYLMSLGAKESDKRVYVL